MPKFLDTHRIQAALAAIAARQHGVITTAQLNHCGLKPSQITDWVRAGRLHRIHRGVYAVGHPGLSIEGEWMAAVLACGKARCSATAARRCSGGCSSRGGPFPT
jgi:predicted transcriptional regulator of viral defense system